ncbi:MAG: type II toxin-antitoxin system PemK/MazF family toxin [Candidatus Kapabacteria bacterium]|jgi:mRNA interferase MazF|nr:type II toxin-antitoxin system PemK/MazF family toxin [Candidatus Kapabacteria bacterium]
MLKNSIVLVPFPFDDFSDTKVRPALCLTSEIGWYENIIISFISSKLSDENLDSDFVLLKNSIFWEGTGLISDSVIRLHKLVTVPKRIIKRKLGSINNDLEIIIKDKLYKLLNA